MGQIRGIRRVVALSILLCMVSTIFILFQNAAPIDGNVTTIQIVSPNSNSSGLVFKAIGDGKANDKPPVLAAFNALLAQTGPAILKFEAGKKYYLQSTNPNRNARIETAPIIFNILSKQNLTIDGQGATLILDPIDDAFAITESANITIKNLKIDYISPVMTQGRIKEKSGSYLDFEVADGFSIPSPKVNNFANITVHDVNGIYLNHIDLFVERIQVNPKGDNPRLVRIFPNTNTVSNLTKVILGSQLAMRRFGEVAGRVFYLYKNQNLMRLENIDIFSAPNISVLANQNWGTLDLDKVNIRLLPSSNRLLAGLSGGFIFHDNRAKITIKHCLVERTLDDAVNLAASAEVAAAIGPSSIDIRSGSKGNLSPVLMNGDTLSAYSFSPNQQKIFLGKSKIKVVSQGDRIRTITLDSPIAGLVALDPATGNAGDQHLQDWNATRFFIDENANPNFFIFNNTFRDKPRSGVLARGTNGLVRANTMSNIGGYGIYAANSLTNNVGPLANNMEISANTFFDIELMTIVLGINVNATNPNPLELHSSIVNNSFSDLTTGAVRLVNSTSINVAGNPSDLSAIFDFKNSSASDERVTSLFKLSGEVGIYFAAELTYCKYQSMDHLKSIWGSGYTTYLSEIPRPPVGRAYIGYCQAHQGVFALDEGGIHQGLIDNGDCQFGSMNKFSLLTGFEDASSLLRFPSLNADAKNKGSCQL